MRGHLVKRSEGSWSVVVEVGRHPGTGKRQQRWFTVKGTKRYAERRLAQIVRDLDAGMVVGPTRMNLGEFLDQWLRDYVSMSVRMVTQERYTRIAARIKVSLGKVKLTALKPQQVQQYYSELLAEGLLPQTVGNHHRVLFGALSRAVKWELLESNVMARVAAPRAVKREMNVLTREQVWTLLEAARGTDYETAIYLAIYFGLRRSELCGLRWSDVDLEAGKLDVSRTLVSVTGAGAQLSEPKSRASRRGISIGAETGAFLRARRAMVKGLGAVGSRQVCARRDGGLMLPHSLTRGYRGIAASCGIEGVRFHDLRHTNASFLLGIGVVMNTVQARMGHESIVTTVDVYGHVAPSSDRRASDELEEYLAAPPKPGDC